MAAKKILYEQEAREGMRRGVRKLARAVAVTLGPRGRNVVIEKSFGAPTVTKDGVSVAKEIDLADKYENLGARLVREAASKTSDAAGDGTTTATVLAEALFEEGLKNVVAGTDAMGIKRGMDKAVTKIVEELRKMSKKIKGHDEIAKVAYIAANNQSGVGEMIADAVDKVGKDGVVTIEEGKSLQTEMKLVQGMQFDRGYQSPYFVTDPKEMKAVLEDPYILIHEKKISSVPKVLPLLEKIARGGKPLVVIAEETDGEALATLVVNKLRGTLKCACAKAPGYGDRRKESLRDIAVLTDGKAIFEDLGIDLEKIEIADLGRAKKVVMDKDTTTIIQGAGKKETIGGRIEQIKIAIEETTSDYDREKLQERLAKLAGGVAEINVGGATEVEVKEKKPRYQNALNATKAALEEGVLPGGGVALIRALRALDGTDLEDAEAVGVDVVRRALSAPLRRIAENAGLDGPVILDKVLKLKQNEGYDALAGEYCDMMKAGVIDPTKVVRSALQNGASVAGLLLTTEVAIAEVPEKKAPFHPAEEDYGENF
jgi:chaperonin GroEL